MSFPQYFGGHLGRIRLNYIFFLHTQGLYNLLELFENAAIQ